MKSVTVNYGKRLAFSVSGHCYNKNNERKTMESLNEIFEEMDTLVSDLFTKIDNMKEGN